MDTTSTSKGVILLLLAFTLWGVFPIYFTWVKNVNAFEVLAHRIVWSALILLIVLYFTNQIKTILEHIKNKWMIKQLFIASIFISSNWLIFIYAVSQEKILETAIGYYTAPLLTIAIGVFFLKERLNKYKLIALFFVFLAVLYQWVSLEGFPFIIIGLSVSFSLYSVIKKHIKINGLMSLFIEVLFLLPFSILFLLYLFYNNELVFIQNSQLDMSFLLLCSGIVTISPLLLFAKGVKMVPLYLSGFMQYITPTVSFLIAILVYNEELSLDKIITFSLLWLGLSIFIISEIVSIYRSSNK